MPHAWLKINPLLYPTLAVVSKQFRYYICVHAYEFYTHIRYLRLFWDSFVEGLYSMEAEGNGLPTSPTLLDYSAHSIYGGKRTENNLDVKSNIVPLPHDERKERKGPTMTGVDSLGESNRSDDDDKLKRECSSLEQAPLLDIVVEFNRVDPILRNLNIVAEDQDRFPRHRRRNDSYRCNADYDSSGPSTRSDDHSLGKSNVPVVYNLALGRHITKSIRSLVAYSD